MASKMARVPLKPSEGDLRTQGLRALARMIAKAHLAALNPGTKNSSPSGPSSQNGE